jgi:hypothetical protein
VTKLSNIAFIKLLDHNTYTQSLVNAQWVFRNDHPPWNLSWSHQWVEYLCTHHPDQTNITSHPSGPSGPSQTSPSSHSYLLSQQLAAEITEVFCCCCCCCLVGLGFELRASCLQTSPFCSGYFGDGVSRTIFLGWSQTAILLMSASQVARITSMRHCHPAHLAVFEL